MSVEGDLLVQNFYNYDTAEAQLYAQALGQCANLLPSHILAGYDSDDSLNQPPARPTKR